MSIWSCLLSSVGSRVPLPTLCVEWIHPALALFCHELATCAYIHTHIYLCTHAHAHACTHQLKVMGPARSGEVEEEFTWNLRTREEILPRRGARVFIHSLEAIQLDHYTLHQ